MFECSAKTEVLDEQTPTGKTWGPKISDGDIWVDLPEDTGSGDSFETAQLTEVLHSLRAGTCPGLQNTAEVPLPQGNSAHP